MNCLYREQWKLVDFGLAHSKSAQSKAQPCFTLQKINGILRRIQRLTRYLGVAQPMKAQSIAKKHTHKHYKNF